MIFIAYICLATHTTNAQNTKERMSYYDSLIHSELSKPAKPKKKIEEKDDTQKNSKPQKGKKGKKGKKSNKQSVTKKQNIQADSTIENESQIIDKIFLEDKSATENHHSEFPSPIWYGKDFSDSRVRKHNHATLDSLPDEIRIQLVKDSNDFCFPIKNIITSPYGWRERWNRPHRGVDIALRTGDKIYCCFDGIVRIARPLGAYGNLVVVRHYNGLETIYGH
jgi:murein DD-endopeptidase MepM/ murein hydrolase activator NlpD